MSDDPSVRAMSLKEVFAVRSLRRCKSLPLHLGDGRRQEPFRVGTQILSDGLSYEPEGLAERAAGKPGLFEVCDQGTAFLDEIAEMTIEHRAFQERVGGGHRAKTRELSAPNRAPARGESERR